METLKTNNIIHTTRNIVATTALAGVLTLGVSSCGKATINDINKQRNEVEVLSANISHFIDARKKLVNDYNAILGYPKTEANKYEIDNHLCLLEEKIYDYDEKIKNLIEEKLDAEVTLNEKIKTVGIPGVHSAIDPNKWDYLLTVQ